MTTKHRDVQWRVLWYWPNVIGYVRLALTLAAVYLAWQRPILFIVLYAIQATLDGIDGYVARRLNQISPFGAWLDVVIDNVSRTLLWCYIAPTFGPLIACLEWLTFACTHASGPAWKHQFDDAPEWVAAVMRKGFRTPLGVYVIAGIHVLPIVLYGRANHVDELFLPAWLSYGSVLILSSGRIYGMCVELWVVARHMRALLSQPQEA
ncbi:hypothetical protein PTSG_02403 [Salpingoeca rosetta]|uniref:CDP-alcohol phosphatidyltransferase n=1 Tax=Salpingoeca rosetta (strain ATCC 50818 / BSB-021) TaxID=946362 RepID=F2U238_SALR5|nr:uncharacterized protein PTSG_02403 [Salpingoeca rosetta]EGD81690.1 hypothetical protein PTSG_02403 [Salpingoeca rosetta]|eukprot:XP_004996894.1 hypothetical protein PTSG_02403 [Salpingoeca rosetta]